ncbi:MAG: 4'-phosphopantetheinyl transferase superfamily protein [Synechococcaceae cyanobacterium]|nr:4'-phosphopantetheinyl transferase superfamily protein [Synechococcaceae cyanobacterium]
MLCPHPWRLPDPPPLAAPVLLLDLRDSLPEPLRAELAASLAPQERERHRGLRLPADRERFLRGRGALRRLLAAWRNEAPAAVPIEVAPRGKPRCAGGPEFNVSHSGDLILLAVHRSRPVGVDVEQLRPGLDWRPIARRVLPPEQCRALQARVAGLDSAAAEREGAEAFLAAWCRLEARLKAEGVGLAGLGDARQTPVAADAGVQLWDLAVPAGYCAALAVGTRGACESGRPQGVT